MSHLLYIFFEIIMPVFLLIAVGFVLQKKFKLDLYTLSKINIYYLSPAIIFSKLYDTSFSVQLFFRVVGFTGLFVILLYFVTVFLGKMLRLDKRKYTAFSHSILFYNSGNFGIPVNELVFKDPLAMSIQVAVMVFQNTFIFSYGVFALSAMNAGKWKALLSYFKLPLFYAMFFGLALNMANVDLPNFITTSVHYVADAMIAVALLTLGAQISGLKLSFIDIPLYISMMTRLLIAPVIAFLLLKGLGLDGIIAQALLISTAMPTAVNSSIIAQEYNNEPDFAAQTVITSTLFSSVTLTLVISAAMEFF